MNYLHLAHLSDIVREMEATEHFHAEMRELSAKYLLDYRDESPLEIYELGAKIASRKGEDFDTTADYNWQENDRIWGFGEHRLFSWLSVWLLRQDSLLHPLLNSPITAQNLKGIRKLQLIFEAKSSEFLLYEFKTIISRDRKVKSIWKESGRNKLKKIMQEYLKDPENRKKMVRWKYVSYCLFLESDLEVFHTPQQCREQWINHLSPDVNKSEWTRQEDALLFSCIKEFGCKWSIISRKMPSKRSEHMIKNRYHSVVKDRCRREGWKSFNLQELEEVVRELNELVEIKHEPSLKIEEQSSLEVKQIIETKSQTKKAPAKRKRREFDEINPKAVPYAFQLSQISVKTRAKRVKQSRQTQDSKSTSKQIEEEHEPLCDIKIQNNEQLAGDVTFPFLHCITDEEWYHNLEEKTHLSWLMID